MIFALLLKHLGFHNRLILFLLTDRDCFIVFQTMHATLLFTGYIEMFLKSVPQNSCVTVNQQNIIITVLTGD